MSTEEIYNYRQVSDQIITGGQPTEEQLRAAAAEGVGAVINLATIDPRYSLPDEAGLVGSLGMAYYHIPVEWSDPQRGDFEAFERIMAQLPPQKLLIHCAANFRVTAFVAIYALKHLGWTTAQARAFRSSVWAGSDEPVWEAFIGTLAPGLADQDASTGEA